ncbi:putative E3 ubiquitin-protein ligase XBOS34 [Acorus gramineus]|uniref:E3 ubiquitin-protein ligase XBOS34 n=1 Tax=Acorus gramineus TaxID=55184 RepID=A0AAV9AUC7_ACOGR|nr:putative E3 ubiquitin-protein ligase XBOS34 [Acorus gramineus]
MGAQQSKEELLYQQVEYGNVEGIKALRRDGAGLEWVDREGKTPLITACLKHDHLHVAKVLIELGANVNAYRPGSQAGTPLHHAAKRGLELTVRLLLSHGANPLIRNDGCQTPLDIARSKGHCNVVRVIENHICLFSGWMREVVLPGFLETIAPQWVSRKIWAVVLPCDSRNPMSSLKLDLAIYPGLQVAEPRLVIPLWKVKVEEVKANHTDRAVVIVDNTNKTRYKFLSAYEGDKHQLQWFYNACRGTPQLNTIPPLVTPATAPGATPPEDMELAMAINASIQSALIEGVPLLSNNEPPRPLTDNTNGWGSSSENSSHNGLGPSSGPLPPPKEPPTDPFNGWAVSEAGPSGTTSQQHENQHVLQNIAPLVTDTPSVPPPSAPPIPGEIADTGPIHYPAIETSPVDIAVPVIETKVGGDESKRESGGSSSCVICLDAPVEGACIPCGHMAGCMSCLNEIKGKNWGCPVCRSEIDQVIRLYAV